MGGGQLGMFLDVSRYFCFFQMPKPWGLVQLCQILMRACQVYPPGDPLNLHFDPMQLPRDGSPQVGHADANSGVQ